MKRIIFWILSGIMVVVMLGLIAYYMLSGATLDTVRIVKCVIVLAGCLIGLWNAVIRNRQQWKEIYMEAYGRIIRDTFSDSPKQFKMLMQGIKYYDNDHLREAVSCLGKLLPTCRTDQERAVTGYFMAACFIDQNYYRKAIEMLEQVQTWDPAISEVNNDIGICYMDQGKYNKALPYLLKAHEVRPEDAVVCVNLSCCYESIGDWEQMNYWAKEVLEIAPRNLEGLMYAYLSELHLDHLEEAQPYRERFAMENGGADGLLSLGEAILAEKKVKENLF